MSLQSFPDSGTHYDNYTGDRLDHIACKFRGWGLTVIGQVCVVSVLAGGCVLHGGALGSRRAQRRWAGQVGWAQAGDAVTVAGCTSAVATVTVRDSGS
jgi:hypothetical protein